MGKMYAMGFDLKMAEYDIEGFLMGIGEAVNSIGKTVVKHKVKTKIKKKKLIIKVKVKFVDGTKMSFKHKSEFGLAVPLMEVTKEQLMQELANQGVAVAQQQKPEVEEKTIGFDLKGYK